MPASKRIFDLLIAAILLVITMPLLLVTGLLVWIFLGAPILYLQPRAGYKGRPFRPYKFRTMSDRRDAQGKALPDAERLTRFGRFIRAASLDDLPQLLNVLRGEMSLVGPRPLFLRYLDRYSPEQMRRHDVHPGLTGWAQVNGRNALTWDEKFTLDVWYVDHWSFWLDMRILWMTPWKVLAREGVNQPGHATAEEFMGNDQAVKEA
jgi:sugar transferase EpsL